MTGVPVLSPLLNSYAVILKTVQRQRLCEFTFKFPTEPLKWTMRVLEVNRQQATGYTPQELTALLDLTQKRSSNTSKLLGYKVGTRDCLGLGPGGFIVWLV